MPAFTSWLTTPRIEDSRSDGQLATPLNDATGVCSTLATPSDKPLSNDTDKSSESSLSSESELHDSELSQFSNIEFQQEFLNSEFYASLTDVDYQDELNNNFAARDTADVDVSAIVTSPVNVLALDLPIVDTDLQYSDNTFEDSSS